MKLKLTMLLLSLILFVSVNASVITVSNNSGGAAQFTQLNPAIAAASAGDTIYVSGSNIVYNAFTISKSLTIIGPGSFSDKQNGYAAKVGTVSFISNLSAIKLRGFYFNGDVLFNNTLTNISNLEIAGNYFASHLSFADASNFFNLNINNNIFSSGGIFGKISFAQAVGFSNVIIQNNLFFGPITALNATNAVISNNVFVNTSNAFQGYSSFFTNNAIIKDNIFYDANPTNNTVGCSYLNNISFSTGSTFGSMGGTANLDNTNPNFVNVIAGNYTPAFSFHLQVGSPGIGAGSNGTEIGFYGGTIAASTSGETENLPVIRLMNIQNQNLPQNGNVNVKVRSTKAR